jgi:two-component system phosphate regulon sensor histidine kinase PhoR
MKLFLRYFAIIYIPIAIVLIVVLYFSNTLLTASADRELTGEMKSKWHILKEYISVDRADSASHEKIASISRQTSLRITVIDIDGRVIDDSYLDFASVPEMENHRDRPEIKKAIYEEEGYATRFSTTLGTEMIYYAKKAGDDRVLRVAYPVTYVDSLGKGFRNQNITIFALLFLIIGLISAYLASRISIPVARLDEITDRIDSGKMHVHFPRFKDPTMARISGLIYRIYTLMRGEQKRLIQEQEKLSLILEVLDEAILFLDKHNNVLLFNSKAEEYLEIDLKISMNIISTLTDYQTITFLKEALSTEGATAETKQLRGRTFDIYSRRVNDGKLLVFSDITEKRQYEDFKTELIGNISHELKTPISMILGYAETIAGDPDMKKEVLSKFLDTIFGSAKRLNDIINDVLELHKLESIDRAFEVPGPSDIDSVVDAVDGVFAKIEGKKIVYTVNVERAWILFEHVTSILTNLVDNAVKYSSGDNVYVTIAREKETIIVEVEDEGPVIAHEERKRIFERFYTVSKSREKPKSGTGLGLSIVKHIAHLYDGSVTLKENEHGGNTFTVILYERIPR